MIVVDAGVWALALTSSDPLGDWARDAMSSDPHWVMPAHGPVETLRTIRKLEAAGLVTAKGADAAVGAMCETELESVAPEPWLLDAIWDLRQNVSPYDAAYVVIAKRAGCVLVTLDKRLARACAALGVRVLAPQGADRTNESPGSV